MALINYHGKNMLTVNYAVPNPHNLETRSVVFMPGLNEISEEALAKIQENPCVMGRFENGKLEVLGAGQLGADDKKSVIEMLALIPKIVQSKLLKKIIESDDREQVQRAAKARLDVVTGNTQNEKIKNHANIR